jgi:hypothetical protein
MSPAPGGLPAKASRLGDPRQPAARGDSRIPLASAARLIGPMM